MTFRVHLDSSNFDVAFMNIFLIFVSIGNYLLYTLFYICRILFHDQFWIFLYFHKVLYKACERTKIFLKSEYESMSHSHKNMYFLYNLILFKAIAAK